MGSLIDRDELIANLEKKMVGAYAAKAAIRIVSSAPVIKAYPERTAQIELRVFGDRAKHICTACENAMPEREIPARMRFCWKCGARITGTKDTVSCE